MDDNAFDDRMNKRSWIIIVKEVEKNSNPCKFLQVFAKLARNFLVLESIT